MPTAQTKTEVTHESINRLSREYPDDEFRLLGHHRTDGGMYVLFESPVDAATMTPYFESDSAVTEYEVLHTDDRTTFVQLRIDRPATYRAVLHSGNLPRSPLVVRDGWIYGEITTSMEGIQKFVSGLQERDVRYEIVSLTQSYDDDDLLTDRQREVVREAVDRGYYETPRACTLSDIADALAVNKSTVGDVLNRAEGRIITQFMSDNPL